VGDLKTLTDAKGSVTQWKYNPEEVNSTGQLLHEAKPRKTI